MHIFYTPDIHDKVYTLSEEESKHCIRVLRLSKGDVVYLIDGIGGFYETEIFENNPKACKIKVIKKTENYNKRNYSVSIAVAPTKNSDRYEWFLEKATEIGVDEIIPIECEHSERRITKTDRSMKVIISAVKQSIKAHVPELREMTPFMDLIKEKFDGEKYIAHCNDSQEKQNLKDLLNKNSKYLILIGPEGDFSEAEIAAAKKEGFKEISLGKERLRTETAALAAVHTAAIINQ